MRALSTDRRRKPDRVPTLTTRRSAVRQCDRFFKRPKGRQLVIRNLGQFESSGEAPSCRQARLHPAPAVPNLFQRRQPTLGEEDREKSHSVLFESKRTVSHEHPIHPGSPAPYASPPSSTIYRHIPGFFELTKNVKKTVTVSLPASLLKKVNDNNNKHFFLISGTRGGAETDKR
jgi:hypothetical protein